MKRLTFEKLACATFLFMYKICKVFIWFFNKKFLLEETSRKTDFFPQNSYILLLFNNESNILYIGIQCVFWILPLVTHSSKRGVYSLAHLWTNKFRLTWLSDWLTKVSEAKSMEESGPWIRSSDSNLKLHSQHMLTI